MSVISGKGASIEMLDCQSQKRNELLHYRYNCVDQRRSQEKLALTKILDPLLCT